MLALGSGSAQCAVTGACVRAASRVQVITGLAGARQRPVVFIAPDILTHDENAHRLLALHTILNALQQVIVPAQHALEDEFGFAIGIGRCLRRVFGDRHLLWLAVNGGS